MFKKIITGILAAATLTLSAVPSAFAVTATTPYTHVNNGKHAEGSLVLYSYNVPATTNDYVSLTNRSTGKTTDVQCSSFVYHPVSYTFDKNAEFTSMVGSSLSPFGGSGTAPSIDMATSAGRYEKVRIKLSDFDSEFNSDGSITKSVDHYGKHKFRFCEESADSTGSRFTSALYFFSGSAINHVVPNKNGEVEIYVYRKIGESIRYATHFLSVVVYKDSSGQSHTVSSTGGGTSGRYLKGLTVGDPDLNGYVSINDVTAIQKYLAHRLTLSDLQLRNADANLDNDLDIDDATDIQRYLAS